MLKGEKAGGGEYNSHYRDGNFFVQTFWTPRVDEGPKIDYPFEVQGKIPAPNLRGVGGPFVIIRIKK